RVCVAGHHCWRAKHRRCVLGRDQRRSGKCDRGRQSVSRHQIAAALGMTVLSRHGALVLFLVIFAAILAVQIDHGLTSGDGHGIIGTVETLLSRGQIDVSRPPGHPTTELYLFGAVGWILLNAFGIEFGDKAYLVCQAIAALATLVVFYELLLRIGASRARAILTTICLAAS